MASIIVTTPSGEESHYRLGKGPIVIGRGENVPIQVVDFVDRSNAFEHHKKAGERYRGTEMYEER